MGGAGRGGVTAHYPGWYVYMCTHMQTCTTIHSHTCTHLYTLVQTCIHTPHPHPHSYRPDFGVVFVTVSAALSAILNILSHILGDLCRPLTIYTRNDCVRAPMVSLVCGCGRAALVCDVAPAVCCGAARARALLPPPPPTAVVKMVVTGVWSSSPLESTSLTPSAVVVDGPIPSSSLLLLLPLSLCVI